MNSDMLALNEVELDAVSGGGKLAPGEVCSSNITVISTSWGTLTLGTTTCTFGSGNQISHPFGGWQPA